MAGRATWCPRSKNDDDTRTTVAALGEKLGRGTVKRGKAAVCRPRGQSSVPETISENLKVRRERGERLSRDTS